ncbi:junctional sarcoplasmic reticulum protein 1 [Tachyglossus aculeatus]|uniref:junctional sarcoplasmic reticulum protein 1 n=1 Tax=Tachyglossus aculeatus TaxID=9261 RepID=UPI0018F5A9DF|nr:junctional sarcoplasmic reticulum protein 1 [Tachyglossus aculeatus]
MRLTRIWTTWGKVQLAQREKETRKQTRVRAQSAPKQVTFWSVPAREGVGSGNRQEDKIQEGLPPRTAPAPKSAPARKKPKPLKSPPPPLSPPWTSGGPKGDELPWGEITLNKCLVLASVVAVLSVAFQLFQEAQDAIDGEEEAPEPAPTLWVQPGSHAPSQSNNKLLELLLCWLCPQEEKAREALEPPETGFLASWFGSPEPDGPPGFTAQGKEKPKASPSQGELAGEPPEEPGKITPGATDSPGGASPEPGPPDVQPPSASVGLREKPSKKDEKFRNRKGPRKEVQAKAPGREWEGYEGAPGKGGPQGHQGSKKPKRGGQWSPRPWEAKPNHSRKPQGGSGWPQPEHKGKRERAGDRDRFFGKHKHPDREGKRRD